MGASLPQGQGAGTSGLGVMIFCIAAAGAAHAQVYKCVTPQGVSYSQSPCPGGAELGADVLNSNTVGAQPRLRSEPPRAPAAPQAVVIEQQRGVCPDERQVRNIETSAAATFYDRQPHERSFILNEIQLAKRCDPTSSGYTAKDWSDIFRLHPDLSSTQAGHREAAKSEIRAIHRRAADSRTRHAVDQQQANEEHERQERRAQREARRQELRNAPAPGFPDALASCIRGTPNCRGQSGADYLRDPSGNGFTRRSDGARCRASAGGRLDCF